LIYLLFENYFRSGGLILRIAAAAVLSFVIVMMLAPRLILFLLKRRIRDVPEFNHADLNALSRHKSRTPTMGGALILVAIFVSALLFANLSNGYILMGLFALVWLGGLGAIDDWIKLRYSAGKGSRDGLRMWEKILFQVGLAVLLALFLRWYGRQTESVYHLYLPFMVPQVYLPLLAYVIITVLTMVGSSNAVNLTDGMDGLAAGCVIIVTVVFTLVAWVAGVRSWAVDIFHLPPVDGSAEMTILCAAMIGSTLGFLWYNAHPAQIFMGDTGSQPLGGLLGYIAVVTRQELLLLVAGGVFVMEALSVVMQIGYYKLTKPPGGLQGKRLFRCAPIHHHFHLRGWAETKVVVRFWLLSVIFAALALATLKLR